MAPLRKNLFWIGIGVVALAVVGFHFTVVAGVRGDVKTVVGELSGHRDRLEGIGQNQQQHPTLYSSRQADEYRRARADLEARIAESWEMLRGWDEPFERIFGVPAGSAEPHDALWVPQFLDRVGGRSGEETGHLPWLRRQGRFGYVDGTGGTDLDVIRNNLDYPKWVVRGESPPSRMPIEEMRRHQKQFWILRTLVGGPPFRMEDGTPVEGIPEGILGRVGGVRFSSIGGDRDREAMSGIRFHPPETPPGDRGRYLEIIPIDLAVLIDFRRVPDLFHEILASPRPFEIESWRIAETKTEGLRGDRDERGAIVTLSMRIHAIDFRPEPRGNGS